MKSQAVDQKQIKLLKELFEKEFLKDYFLVGGTNLALRYNHRHSVDLDLFVNKDFNLADSTNLHKELLNSFNDRYIENQVSEVGIFCFIDEIKVDFVKDPQALLKPLIKIDNFRLADIEDIAAMKINAVTGRGSKKDFYDIYELLQHYSIDQLLEFYRKKYKISNLFHVRRSLNYFNDAEKTEIRNNTVSSLKDVSWKDIKFFIDKKVKQNFIKNKGRKL